PRSRAPPLHDALPISLLDPGGDVLDQLVLLALLDQLDERLDLGVEPDQLRVELGVGGGDGRQAVEEGEPAEAEGGRLEERAAVRDRKSTRLNSSHVSI